MEEELKTLQRWVDESSRIVFFGGAGVSTESGIPDFRSVDGLYHQHYSEPPETILSHSYFVNNPEGFFRFYRDKMLFPGRTTQCGPPQAGRAGAGGQADGGGDSEYRRPAPEGREQAGL